MRHASLYRKLTFCSAAAAFGVCVMSVKLALAADKESEIQGIMKNGFKSSKTKSSIFKKATTGDASAEELKTLLDYVQKLQKDTPPQGEQKDWDTRTDALVKATQAAIKGDKDAGKTLATAGACKDCHKLHQKPQ